MLFREGEQRWLGGHRETGNSAGLALETVPSKTGVGRELYSSFDVITECQLPNKQGVNSLGEEQAAVSRGGREVMFPDGEACCCEIVVFGLEVCPGLLSVAVIF